MRQHVVEKISKEMQRDSETENICWPVSMILSLDPAVSSLA